MVNISLCLGQRCVDLSALPQTKAFRQPPPENTPLGWTMRGQRPNCAMYQYRLISRAHMNIICLRCRTYLHELLDSSGLGPMV